nr:portal protein [Escherichia coli]
MILISSPSIIISHLPSVAGFQEVARRSVKRRRVYVSVVDGDGFLEKPRRIPGEHIPLISTVSGVSTRTKSAGSGAILQ